MTDQLNALASRLRVALAASGNGAAGQAARFLQGGRRWLAVVAVLVALSAVLPPAATYARQYAFVQALQFSVFAVLTPALLTLGMRSRHAVKRHLTGEHVCGTRPPARAAAWRLVPFMTLVIIWRLPAVLGALARYPVLSTAEPVTLVVAGLGVWMAIAGLTVPEPLPRPLRAAMAAVAMWTIWIIAYVTGMSSLALIPRSGSAAEILGPAADRQLATAVLWAVPAICFAPVVYYLLMSWLGERGEEVHEHPEAQDLAATNLTLADRAPQNWRHRGRSRAG
jgi:Cytochrome c oxidase caa3 assembly factor (Caa3_CtaG)